ncbi:MAG: Mut7-C RNAse domain-containing protein [Desulfovibrionaceae bacterium]
MSPRSAPCPPIPAPGPGEVRLAFDPGLAGLLTRPAPDGVVVWPVTRRASIKDVAESLGVPHTEIYRVVPAGATPIPALIPTLDLDLLLAPGMALALLGPDGPVDVTRATPLRPALAAAGRFLADVNVARLAGLLRLAGFDAKAAAARDRDGDLARRAAETGRILLSRDRALLKRSVVVHARLVRAQRPWDQLSEVAALYGLAPRVAPFTRCIHCNGLLTDVPKAEVLDRLEPLTRRHYERFSRCPDCGRVYWAGSHFGHMRRELARRGLWPAAGDGSVNPA